MVSGRCSSPSDRQGVSELETWTNELYRHLSKMSSRHLKILTCKGQVFICLREKARETTVYKAGSKILTWLNVSPVYKL